MTERARGNVLVRSRRGEPQGSRTPPHSHKNHHLSIPRQGWYLGRHFKEDGGEVVFQIAELEYSGLRRMLLRYQPHRALRPCRGPDLADGDGKPCLNVVFIGHDEQVPEGFAEIEFAPREDIVIRKGVEHEFVALAEINGYDCIFPHFGWDGEIVEDYLGNLAATM